MSHFPGDPKQRFPHPENTEILGVLESLSSPQSTDPDDMIIDLDDYDLHTHPELYDRLLMISRSLPEQCFSAAFGYAILVTQGGVIFGAAGGIGLITLRLAPYMQPDASVLDTRLYAENVRDWICFHPQTSSLDKWGRPLVNLVNLHAWSKYAFDYAKQLE